MKLQAFIVSFIDSTQNKDTYHNWVYLNLLTIIASAYEKTDKLEEAKLT